MSTSSKYKESMHPVDIIFKRCLYFLIIFQLLLGVAHILWPEYHWGQGRSSYFNFNNRLTLASWLASMQLAGIAILAFFAFWREKQKNNLKDLATTGLWLAGALFALLLSFCELTRFHQRLNLFGYPLAGPYEKILFFSIWLAVLYAFGWFLICKLRYVPGYFKYAIGWLGAWSVELFLRILATSDVLPATWNLEISLVIGWAYLFGCTMLMMSLGGFVLRFPENAKHRSAAARGYLPGSFPEAANRVWVLLGVGGMTFVIIILQLILFQVLMILGDYLTATWIISIALLGISVGGLIGFFAARRSPLAVILFASFILPICILIAISTSASLLSSPFLASILLAFPFICGSTVISITLIHMRSDVVYCIDLLGAALGALLVSNILRYFREESSMIFLCMLAFLVAGCFALSYPVRRVRAWLLVTAVAGAAVFLSAGVMNIEKDWLNITRAKLIEKYPNVNVLFSKSSLIGRYDVVRRKPHSKTLKAYENGRTIDTIRRTPKDQYVIDPRIPHTLMSDPNILIIGLSGDGITKTARAIGKSVSGVEINPAIVSLQKNELARFNAHSYESIDVSMLDGRSFLEQSDQVYDMITLMNTHAARGFMSGRAPSPEYLHTHEAIRSYLKHLSDRGVLITEEPVRVPRREPPVWKLLVTMRRALIDFGSAQPEKHFFIFQWKTRTNNYIQILMKKTPFTQMEIKNLKRWLHNVDNIRKIEAVEHKKLGPIRSKSTILYCPDGVFSTNYARILVGEKGENSCRART